MNNRVFGVTKKHIPAFPMGASAADEAAWRRAAFLYAVYAPVILADEAVTDADLWSGARLLERRR